LACSLLNGLSCEELCWHGFCIVRAIYAAAFDAYLYALGQRANQTGNFSLDFLE